MLESIPFDSRTASLALAALFVAATAVYGQRRRLGPNADWIEIARATCLPVLDPLVERYAGGVGTAYELGEREYVGRIHESPGTVEHLLWDVGYRRNTMSAFKTTPDGRSQRGAWVYRGDAVPADRQVDVMLFAADDGRATDVYAHEEYSSALRWLREDPSVLRRHYQGVAYSPDEGIKHVVGQLWARSPMGLSDTAKDVLADLPGGSSNK